MAFALTITFPLGYYQGRDPNGEPELYPTMNRLYSALIAAAFEANITDPPRDILLDTLVWLEGRAPDAVTLPDVRATWMQEATAYRDKGASTKDSKAGTINPRRPQSERATRAAAVDGPVVFWWNEDPGPERLRVFEILAEEIPYIGERASIARVEAARCGQIDSRALPVTANYLLPDSQAVRLDYPELGRLRELSDAYEAARPKRPPTDAQDLPASKEEERFAPAPRTCVGQARYKKPTLAPSPSPWTHGFLVEVGPTDERQSRNPRTGPRTDEDDTVGWSVALHRAIIKQLGWGAPAMITGKYAAGIEQPANHMAIQLLPAGLRPHGWEAAETRAFAVLFPPEATASERAATRRALLNLRSLYRGRQGRLNLGRVVEFDPTRFWGPTPTGSNRHWRPTPGAVVEIRARQRGPGGSAWTLDDVLRLAVGFVWRDRFGTEELRGLPLYLHLAEAAEQAGVTVRDAHKVHPTPGVKATHRRAVPDALTLLSGEITLSGLGVDRQLIAIGQSRHLGGGLLLPRDLSDQTTEEE